MTERFRPRQRVPSAQSLVLARRQVRRTGSDDTVRAVVETLVRNRALGERIARYPGVIDAVEGCPSLLADPLESSETQQLAQAYDAYLASKR